MPHPEPMECRQPYYRKVTGVSRITYKNTAERPIFIELTCTLSSVRIPRCTHFKIGFSRLSVARLSRCDLSTSWYHKYCRDEINFVKTHVTSSVTASGEFQSRARLLRGQFANTPSCHGQRWPFSKKVKVRFS